ncbi:hypothetical protein CALCODRAFT_405359, partial [Calocera cornea HHB12733]
ATIALDSVLGNKDGNSVWGLKAITKSARNISFDGKLLKAELRTINGDWRHSEVDLT